MTNVSEVTAGAALLALLFFLAVAVRTWVGVDAARRNRNWFAWAIALELLSVFALGGWLFSRRRSQPAPEGVSVRLGSLILLTTLILMALGVVVRTYWTTFVFQVARVQGQAMAPSLNDGDRLFVSKMAFRVRDPRADEIVMLHYPNDPSKTFVMRVIGEEGDAVRIVDGHVFRNDIPLDDRYVSSQFQSHENWGPSVVPEGYYFVMGDRRNNSSDSRHWGFVPKKYIVGRVVYRWWPLARAGSI